MERNLSDQDRVTWEPSLVHPCAKPLEARIVTLPNQAISWQLRSQFLRCATEQKDSAGLLSNLSRTVPAQDAVHRSTT
jgi:hypothetical protein